MESIHELVGYLIIFKEFFRLVDIVIRITWTVFVMMAILLHVSSGDHTDFKSFGCLLRFTLLANRVCWFIIIVIRLVRLFILLLTMVVGIGILPVIFGMGVVSLISRHFTRAIFALNEVALNSFSAAILEGDFQFIFFPEARDWHKAIARVLVLWDTSWEFSTSDN